MLVVTAVSSINTRWAGSRKPCSRIQRWRPRATSARLRSAARRLFLMVMPWRAKKRDSALRLPRIRRLRSAETISSSVRSGCAPMTARICRECFSKGEVLPPRGIGSQVPSSRKCCTYRIAELTLTELFSRPTSRSSSFDEVNDAQSQLTRIRSMHWSALRRIKCVRLPHPVRLGNPDSLRSGRAVTRAADVG
jgi:hypothetical protein